MDRATIGRFAKEYVSDEDMDACPLLNHVIG